MKAIVCGGRTFDDVEFAFSVLDGSKISHVIEGGAWGADRIARSWAEKRGIPYDTYEADWKMKGRAAGPIRNQRMLDEGKPDIVIAFPGGRGTENMIQRAEKAGVPVFRATPGRDDDG